MDITILKVTHATKAEAQKPEPYVEKASVFGSENAGMTAEQAVIEEGHWRTLLWIDASAFPLIMRGCLPVSSREE